MAAKTPQTETRLGPTFRSNLFIHHKQQRRFLPMFKKIFHTSAVGKAVEDSKASSISESSISEESEIITAGEIPKPEKRFFLRRPSKIKPAPEESPLSYFRTFDPFDIKSSLKRSSSFAFKSKHEESEPATLGLPRSKSVHFADNLATYHEFKPSFGADFDELESNFEEFYRHRKHEGEGESESESENENEEDDEGLEEEEEEEKDYEVAENEGSAYKETEDQGCEEKFKTQKNQIKAEVFTQTEDPKENGPETNHSDSFPETRRGVNLAGKHLQSVFTGTMSESDLSCMPKNGVFDNSDSTDVDSLNDGKKDKDMEFFYDIYEQLCDLRQIKAKDETCFDIIQLKGEIGCAIADIGDCLSDTRDQLEQSNKEVRKLRHTLQSASHQIETHAAAATKLKHLSQEFKDFQEATKEREILLNSLQEKTKSLDASRALETQAYDGKLEAAEAAREELVEMLNKSQKEVSDLRTQIQNSEVSNASQAFARHEREELINQLEKSRKEAKDLQSFQEAEMFVIREECSKFQSQIQILEDQKLETSVSLQELQNSLKAQTVTTQQQLKEADFTVQEFGKRYEEKKTQLGIILESLEALRIQCNFDSKTSLSKKKPVVIDSKLPSTNPDLDLAKDIVTSIQRGIANSKKRDQIITKQLEEIAISNLIGSEALTYLIKASFEILTPIFHKDCAEQFSQMYYEITKSNIFNESKKGILMVLCNFVLNSQRELLSQHSKNEQMLETEIEDRLKYQQQVLDSFTRIVRQVMENNRGPRISGIRGHSSPKKKHAPRHR